MCEVGIPRGETSSHTQKSAFLVTHQSICQYWKGREKVANQLTAHAPATDATIPPEIIMGRTPLELLKIIPLKAPARTLFAESCFPLKCPIKELKPLYTIAITPAEFPKKGPRRV